MNMGDTYVWRRFPGIAVHETTVDILWIGGVLMIAFSFADMRLGLMIGLGVFAIIPIRRFYPEIRGFLQRSFRW
jgi:hypothetical protein